MPSLSYKIGADNSGLIASLAQSQRAVDNFKKKAAASAGGARGGGGRFALANVSMQAQDIAVQMQAGARGATIVAQQGSQILSAFGPYGALAGGVLAIGAGIYSWARGIDDADKKAKEFAANLKNLRDESEKAFAKSIAENAGKAKVMSAPPSQRATTAEEQRYAREVAALEDLAMVDREKKAEAMRLAKQVHELNMQEAKKADAEVHKQFLENLGERARKEHEAEKSIKDFGNKVAKDAHEKKKADADAYDKLVREREKARDEERHAMAKSGAEIMRRDKEKEMEGIAALGKVNDAIAAAKAAGEAAEMDERIRIAGQNPAERRAEKKAVREIRSDEDRAIAAKIRDENEARRQKGQGPMTEDERNARRGQLRGDLDKRKQDAAAQKILGNIYDEIKGLAGKIDAA